MPQHPTKHLKQHHRHFSTHTQHTQPKSFSEVYGELHPDLKKSYQHVYTCIKHKVTRAAPRGIAGALVDPETLSYQGKSYSEVFDIILKAVESTMDNPINIKPDENGTFSSHDIFRRMGKNTFLIKEFVDTSVMRGQEFDVETTIKALRHTHLYSFTPQYELELEGFNKRNKGHQAYDLKRILEIQKHKEQQNSHKRVDDEFFVTDPQDILFTRWMCDFPNHATEQDIARDMFDISTFTPGRSEDEVMRYVIGVWAGALATGLRVALTCNTSNHTFMGWGEGALWPISRMAIADVNKEHFWMPTDNTGKYTRRTIIDSYAISALQTVNELWKQQDGHLHRHMDAYFHSHQESRIAIAKFLRQTYVKSLELCPEKNWQEKIEAETKDKERKL